MLQHAPSVLYAWSWCVGLAGRRCAGTRPHELGGPTTWRRGRAPHGTPRRSRGGAARPRSQRERSTLHRPAQTPALTAIPLQCGRLALRRRMRSCCRRCAFSARSAGLRRTRSASIPATRDTARGLFSKSILCQPGPAKCGWAIVTVPDGERAPRRCYAIDATRTAVRSGQASPPTNRPPTRGDEHLRDTRRDASCRSGARPGQRRAAATQVSASTRTGIPSGRIWTMPPICAISRPAMGVRR